MAAGDFGTAVAGAIKGRVKTVNNQTPDAGGNVNVSAAFTPSGYDVILLAGQSNMVGWSVTGTSDLTDPVHPMIDYVDCYGANGDLGVIKPATRTMDSGSGPGGISPGLHFARWYVTAGLNNGRKVLLVAMAASNTPLVDLTTAATWNPDRPTSNIYLTSVTRTNAALSGNEGSRLVAILWIQGESDAVDGRTGAEYQTVLDRLITGYRTDISGAGLAPFIIGQMVPDYITGARIPINNVQATVASRLPWTAFAYGPVGTAYGQGDGNHYSVAGSRAIGRSMFEAFERVNAGLPAVDRSYRPVVVSSTAPSDRNAVWIDHSGVADPLKLWSGTAWVAASTGFATTTTTTTAATTTSTTTAAATTTTTTTEAGATTTTTTTAATTTTTTTAGYPEGWTPADLPGLDLWLDASTITGLSEGAAVATWSDLSGAGNHATQATGTAQPLYTTAQGYPALSFDGTNHYMSSTASASAASHTHVAVSWKPVVVESSRTLIGASATIAPSLQINNGGHAYMRNWGGTGDALQNAIGNLSGDWMVYGGTYSPTQITAWMRDRTPATSVAGTFAAGAGKTIRIGANGTADKMSGQIAEVIHCATVLSATDRGYLMAYLMAKYGVTQGI